MSTIPVVSISGSALMQMIFPEPVWLVDGVLPESGCYVLAGKPKCGKSWFSLSLALAAAAGGQFLGKPIPHRRVCVFALEDTQRRLKSRIEKLGVCDDLSDVEFVTTSPRLYSGLEAEIEARCIDGVRVFVLDTLEKIRAPGTRNGNQYAGDYQAVSAIKTIADKYGALVLIIHHVRKGESDDAHDDVSGTNGIAGAADGTLVLRRVHGRPDATLHITGRDVEEAELGLSFDGGVWRHIGSAAEVRAGAEQNEILNVLRAAGGDGLTMAELCDETGKQRRTIAKLLSKLAAAGLARKRSTKPPRYAACDGPAAELVTCPKCHGVGNVGYGKADGKCFQCNGSGSVTAGRASAYTGSTISTTHIYEEERERTQECVSVFSDDENTGTSGSSGSSGTSGTSGSSTHDGHGTTGTGTWPAPDKNENSGTSGSSGTSGTSGSSGTSTKNSVQAGTSGTGTVRSPASSGTAGTAGTHEWYQHGTGKSTVNADSPASSGTAGTAGTDMCGTAVPDEQPAMARPVGSPGTAGTAGTGMCGTAVPVPDEEIF